MALPLWECRLDQGGSDAWIQQVLSWPDPTPMRHCQMKFSKGCWAVSSIKFILNFLPDHPLASEHNQAYPQNDWYRCNWLLRWAQDLVIVWIYQLDCHVHVQPPTLMIPQHLICLSPRLRLHFQAHPQPRWSQALWNNIRVQNQQKLTMKYRMENKYLWEGIRDRYTSDTTRGGAFDFFGRLTGTLCRFAQIFFISMISKLLSFQRYS